MSPKERHALALLIGLGVVGHTARFLTSRPTEAPGEISLLGASTDNTDLARHRARSARLGRPLAVGERVDLNSAPADEIARLPRVGMRLAKAIVRHREARGSISSLAELDSVPGVGANLIEHLAPHLTLGDTVRRRAPAMAIAPTAPAPTFRVPTVRVPTVLAPRKQASKPGPESGTPIDLNTASEADLVRLPGIGPARAKAILAYRQRNGPFASVEGLSRVPGISIGLVRRLGSQVVVR